MAHCLRTDRALALSNSTRVQSLNDVNKLTDAPICNVTSRRGNEAREGAPLTFEGQNPAREIRNIGIAHCVSPMHQKIPVVVDLMLRQTE